jgi:hypothetical protein
MIVWEFWLNDTYQDIDFDSLTTDFYSRGSKFTRKFDGEFGNPIMIMSRNPKTHWVQLLIDDDTPLAVLSLLETGIDIIRDSEPIRKYTVAEGTGPDGPSIEVPIETPKG